MIKGYCWCGCGNKTTGRYLNGHRQLSIDKHKKMFLEIHYCQCGCNEQIGWKKYYTHYGWPKYKSHHHSIIMSQQLKGKPFEERYGVERAEEIKLKIGKNKTWEQRYGVERAKDIRQRRIIWTREKILENTKKIIREQGMPTKSLFCKLYKDGIICSRPTIEKNFSTLENLMKLAGGFFLPPPGITHIGYCENILLNTIEKEKNIKLLRQHRININTRQFYYVDGYDPINNVAYEIDEQYHHKGKKIEDYIREQEIKKQLECEFIRIKV